MLCLAGLSPAVLTETVYGLIFGPLNIIPDEIVLLGTSESIDVFKSSLNTQNIWKEFFNFLNNKKIPVAGKLRYGASSACHSIFSSLSGSTDLKDLQSVEDCEASGNSLLNILRQYTEAPNNRLVVSLAGGRKTMASIITSCMSILARPQDILCHVQVTPPFDHPELKPRFFYPKPGEIHCLPKSRKTYPSEQAVISLYSVPFLRLRELYQAHFESLPFSFKETVSYLQEKTRRTESVPTISFCLSTCEFTVNEKKFHLNPIQSLFVCLYLKKISTGKSVGSWYDLEEDLSTVDNQKIFYHENVSFYRHLKQTRNNFHLEREDLPKIASQITKIMKKAGLSQMECEKIFPDFRKNKHFKYPKENVTIRNP